MNSIEVSIFLVAYNEERFIAQALDSLLMQKTNFDYEIICHDDASTDKTPEIIRDYCKKNKNIIPILQKDNQCKKGLNITLEFMYSLAKGKYIAYCDGDDYWTDPNKLQREYDYMENHKDCVMCLHDFTFLFENENNKFQLSCCGKKERDLSIQDVILWDKKIPQIGTSFFVRELAQNRPDLFRKIGGGEKSKRAISDLPLYIYMCLNGRVHYIPKSMSVWRRTSGTWGSDVDPQRTVAFFNDTIEFFQKLNLLTEYKYNSIIQEKIDSINFDIDYVSCNYKKAFRLSRKIKGKRKAKIIVFIGTISKKIANRIRGVK